ncbi:cytochrome d ubiquinol oxidase subunit II (plasmid) [Skermanella mucosa]|uniref:cytochrome d ubiquinol oxidase subunit II n=1 Tax=Skermanella mucosa TaxID=1789672 RepID=UPI00192BA0B7|nr:cytochrome d ubiquinol oxidase subunit II [Skermanella mucosa]UEM24291.1 cytochrome d ubiquinol oxidase subunit II [Skermanella mucosa]
MVETQLTLIWTGIVGFAVFMYVLRDGFDLGLGILFPFAPSDRDRDIMMNSVAPIWDFNETWLVLGGAGLFAAFPLAYAIVLPALYLPLLAMLIALIFRGVAFEFRFKANKSRFLWNIAFNVGSLVATFVQGAALGAFIQGFQVEGRDFAGGMFDWLTPFAVVCGIALVAGYALLGCTWLIWRSEGSLQNWAYHLAKTLLIVVLGFILLVSIWTPLNHEGIAARWFSWPNIVFLSPVPLITAGITYMLWRSVTERLEVQPFVWSMALFLVSFVGLAVSVWPYVVPPHITIWDASSPPESQVFLLIGMMFLIPTILAYTAFSYWVFRGKVTGETGYH